MDDRLTLLRDEAVRRAFASALGTRRVGRVVEYHDEIATTMDRGTELVRAGALDGTVVVADHQTAGRGRRGRSWGYGPPGSLFIASWLLRVDVDVAPLFGVLAAVPLLRASRALGVEGLSVKWPNDLLLDGRKVAGVLSASVQDGGGGHWIVLGTGIDTHTRAHSAEVAASVTSFAAHGVAVDRLALLDGGPAARAAALSEWRACSAVLGKTVRIDDGIRALVGEAVDLDADGALLLRRDGAVERVVAGDVSLRLA